jgi:hypothetical protein
MERFTREHMELLHAQMEFEHVDEKRSANTATSGVGPSVAVVKYMSSSLLDFDFLGGIHGDDTATKLL